MWRWMILSMLNFPGPASARQAQTANSRVTVIVKELSAGLPDSHAVKRAVPPKADNLSSRPMEIRAPRTIITSDSPVGVWIVPAERVMPWFSP